MITLKDLHLTFKNTSESSHLTSTLEIFKALNLKIEKGAFTGIIGPTGHGKSVLFKVISGLQQVDSGEVIVKSSNIGFMFQEGALFDSFSALDNVAFSLTKGQVPVSMLHKEIRDEVSQRSYDILKRVGLDKAFDKVPGQLSGGMKKRLSLARALVSNPDIALLDDPTSGLDPVASKVIMNLIEEIQADHKITTLVISHDLRRLLPCVKDVVALFDKQIRFKGSLKELLEGGASPEIKYFVECRYLWNDEFHSAVRSN